MTYRELYEKATRQLEKSEITLGEYEEITKPLDEEIRKKGKWIKVTETDFGIGYECSECGRFILTESIDEKKLKDFPYCHCGAEMESED